MSYTADFNLDLAVTDTGHYWYVLFIACIYGIWNKFLHLFSAAYYRNP